jgi:hypothetical protein
VPRALALLTVAILSLGLLGAACTSGDGGGNEVSGPELTLEEYFDRIDGVVERLNRRSDDLDTGFLNIRPNDPIEEQREVAADYFDQALPIIEDLVADFDEINAPDEVSSEHDDFRDVLAGAVEDARGSIDDLNDASTDELAEILGNFVSSLFESAGACAALNEVATENGITTDLNC